MSRTDRRLDGKDEDPAKSKERQRAREKGAERQGPADDDARDGDEPVR